MNKTSISRRLMTGLKPTDWAFSALVKPLSSLLASGANIFLVGFAGDMDKAYTDEPLSAGWKFAQPYIQRFRSPVYSKAGDADCRVKLISNRDSWFPFCLETGIAADAWSRLGEIWQAETGLPLLTTPASTGKAFIWSTLPRGVEFPCLPPELATLIRRNSPQHRQENFQTIAAGYEYDGRWMYAGLCGLDRFPVGKPRLVDTFEPFQPGWYDVSILVPGNWSHIGLIPVQSPEGGWVYPRLPSERIRAIVAEPELTLAVQNGWLIERIYCGWTFDKGRPLQTWAKRLIEMRENSFTEAESLCRGAVRQILNHAIGSIHVPGFEREVLIPESAWRDWRARHANWLDHHFDTVHKPGVGHLVTEYRQTESPLDIYMPHWSATVYALARARVARYALQVDPSELIAINGDAVYLLSEAPWSDSGAVGQLRLKNG